MLGIRMQTKSIWRAWNPVLIVHSHKRSSSVRLSQAPGRCNPRSNGENFTQTQIFAGQVRRRVSCSSHRL